MTYERFGRYTVLDSLGTGGMATVHRATIDIGGGVVREVALKRLLPQFADDKALVEDFVREAKLAAQLQHPNIVRILELGRTGPTYFIAMELVHGHSLLALMKLVVGRRSLVPVGIVVAILTEVLDALDYAGNATDGFGEPLEIVHRDLSPSNIIVTHDGHIKIIDFGVAKSVTGTFTTSSGLVKGKLGYMAGEVLAGKPIDRRADIFSLGVVAWELLAGRRLFVGKNEHDVVAKIRMGATTPPSKLNPACPPELDEIVMHALSRKRADRWPSAAIMRFALDSLRRTYRQTVRDIAAWSRTLAPEPFLEETTTSEILTGDLVPIRASSSRLSYTTMVDSEEVADDANLDDTSQD